MRWRRARLVRSVLLAGAVLFAIAALLGLVGWRNSRADPIVRTARVALPDWPAGAAPVRVVLLADFHLGNPSTDEARLARVVERVASLRPDLVLFAGDLIAGYRPASARDRAPALGRLFSRLRPPLGIVAALGNHDNWSDPAALRRALRAGGVTVVENDAIRRGPLVIGVAGDTVSGHAHLGGTLNARRRLRRAAPGATVYLSHSPDIVRWLPAGPTLLLAGHTHCGQIVLPLIGTLRDVSRLHGNRYRCGLARVGERTTVVTAGIGTSDLPLRFGAPPDLWLLTLGPPPPRARAATRQGTVAGSAGGKGSV